jgi:hypothetical protein
MTTWGEAGVSLIQLDADAIEGALPRVASGLRKYQRLQADLHRTDVSRDVAYQTAFNGFYRVRRDVTWRAAFFQQLEAAKAATPPYATVLTALRQATGRVEASFTSKLVATIDPSMPVIDSVVLKNLRLRLPPATAPDRIERIVGVHDRLREEFASYLATDRGRHLVTRFEEMYPGSGVHPVKRLDLVLWQTRDDEGSGQQRGKPRP